MHGTGDTDDPPGVRYEAALPADERRADGQFYTPPAIARALVRWALPVPVGGPAWGPEDAPSRESDGRLPSVLDPAAGAGAFSLAAHDRIASATGADPREAVDRVALVDVNGTPLSLAADALADRAGVGSGAVRTRAASFFDCEPGDLHPDGDPAGFDAVVGNPPFVRHEALADPAHYRDHLAAFGPAGTAPYRDGDRALSGRSDASVYFLTHATRFLRSGGRLAFVAPRKWLTARYGESLRAFVADYYRVAAVASFPDRAFDGALVDTLLVLLERRADPGGPARLVRLPGRPDGDDLVAATGDARRDAGRGDDPEGHAGRGDGPTGVGGGLTGHAADCPPVDAETDRPATPAAGAAPPGPTVVEHGDRRCVDLPRRRFREAPKLAHHLDAPAPVLRLAGSDRLTPLGTLADVTYGYKTGANDFFFLGPGDRERWPVADRFLSPAVTSGRQVDGRDVGTVETVVLDVHDYVADVLDERSGDAAAAPRRDDPAAAVTAALERDGHDVLRSYVAHGEREGYHERATCAARRVWFDLGPLDPPAVLHPKFFDERVVVARNRGGVVPSNAIDCLRIRDGVDPEALLGALNSTLHRALLECFGRAEGGGALQLMTYELSAVPVLDVRALSAAATDRVAGAFEALVTAAGEAAADGAAAGEAAAGEAAVDGAEAGGTATAGALDRLDRAVLDALEADVPVDRLRECRGEMVARRTDADGDR